MFCKTVKVIGFKGACMIENAVAVKRAIDLAEVDDSIILIRRCTIKKEDDTLRILVVSKATSTTDKGEDFLVVAFNAGLQEDDCRKEICEITPEEYKDILNKKRKLPKGWLLKEALFDGTMIFKDIDSLIKSIQDWNYCVIIDDDPMSKMLGFKCVSGRKWKISAVDFKKSKSKMSLQPSFKTDEDKISFLNFLNTKPPYVEVT
jgi:hypothetical protein